MDRQPRQSRQLLAALLGPGGSEASCETCFADLDSQVEIERAGKEDEFAIPGMRAHLEGCAACREDHDSLIAYLGFGEAHPGLH